MKRSGARRAFTGAVAVAVAVGATALPAFGSHTGAGPAPPVDYVAQRDSLSQPTYLDVVTEAYWVDAFDGEQLYVEVVRPNPETYPGRRFPVVLEASPYHGTIAPRNGNRILPDPRDAQGNQVGMTGFFAARGYAVAMMDLRGTGRSTGCLDHLGPNDGADLETVVEWLASREWSTGRVGMTGHSYVGSTPILAAAQRPDGLVTIVPSAGLASMYDHQFQKGVPYNLQWVGPMYAYEQLAFYRDLPAGVPPPPVVGGGPSGDNWANGPNPQIGCGLPNSAALAGTGQVTGQYEGWHRARDWRSLAAAADIPIFMVHGVNDNAARIPAAEWFFRHRTPRDYDKVWLGQWDHGSTNGRCGSPQNVRVLHPTCRFDQWTYALLAWFDKHLKLRPVETGPPVEVFLNGATPVSVTAIRDPAQLGGRVWTARRWESRASAAALYPDASNMSLAFTPPAGNASAVFGTTLEATSVVGGVGRGRLTFTSQPLARDMLFIGYPELQLNASLSTGEITHLVTSLFRESRDANGNWTQREPMNFCAIQPQLRNGVETISPVVPGEEMALPMQCFTMGHHVHAGQRIVLEVSTSANGSAHHSTFASSDRNITVFTGPDKSRYTLPVPGRGEIFADVPLRATGLVEPSAPPPPVGPAQAGFSDTLGPLAPALGLQHPAVSARREFHVRSGFDNARLVVTGVPNASADVDMYLQRRQVDGNWGPTLVAAEGSATTGETLSARRLVPGRYRIIVVNWAGAPVTVDITGTFFNQDDVPGDA